MGAAQIFVLILVTAAISTGVTSWVLNLRHSSNRLEGSYYPAPASPTAPLGDTAGAAKPPAAIFSPNPLDGDPTAVAEGRKLYLSMNCAGCHGYDAKGGMGPNLTNSYWRYGGTPQRVYETILNGRPQGMPEWGVVLPHRSIWQLVSYIQSLGAMVPANLAQAAASGDLSNKGQNKGANDQQ